MNYINISELVGKTITSINGGEEHLAIKKEILKLKRKRSEMLREFLKPFGVSEFITIAMHKRIDYTIDLCVKKALDKQKEYIRVKECAGGDFCSAHQTQNLKGTNEM